MLATESNLNNSCLVAKELIDDFKKKHPSITSSSQLAKMIGIKQASMNRIENLNTNPSLELIIDIVIGTRNQDKLLDVLGKLNPKLRESFEQSLSHVKQTIMLSEDIAKYFGKDEYCFILLMAFTDRGTTRAQIEKELGKQGVEGLEYLISENVLCEKDGDVIPPERKFTVPQKILKQIFKLCLERCYDETLFGLGVNWLSLQTRACNKEKAMKFIREVFKESFEKIDNEFKTGRLAGEDVVFIGMVSDTITKSSSIQFKKEQGELFQ